MLCAPISGELIRKAAPKATPSPTSIHQWRFPTGTSASTNSRHSPRRPHPERHRRRPHDELTVSRTTNPDAARRHQGGWNGGDLEARDKRRSFQ